MTVTVMLDPDRAQRLHLAAQARGVDDGVLLNEIMQKALDNYVVPSAPTSRRTLGLHAGNFQISNDFDAALPDNYWLGEE